MSSSSGSHESIASSPWFETELEPQPQRANKRMYGRKLLKAQSHISVQILGTRGKEKNKMKMHGENNLISLQPRRCLKYQLHQKA